jgi:gamma-glutamylcyclotransferase
MTEKVFAYGSNMCSGRFLAYGISPQDHEHAALLFAHRLVFNKSSRDGSGKANIQPREDSNVWGVLYTISDADLGSLDRGEGAGYYRTKLPVRVTGGGITEAWVYLASRTMDAPALRPYTWYKRFLVEGAREHSLPPEYIAELERIEAVQDTDEQRDREKRALGCGATS